MNGTVQVYDRDDTPHAGAVVKQEFAGNSMQQSGELASTAVAAQSKAMVEARYVMAERHPRDWDAVRVTLLKDCRRPFFADSARYLKPIGKGVEGWSIRFVESALAAMSNISVEVVAVFEDTAKRVLRVLVSDVEKNTAYSQDVTVHKSVERRQTKKGDTVLKMRTNSHGNTVYVIEATEDEILNQANALVSKAVRTLGLRLIPGWLQDECLATVRKVTSDQDAKDPDAARNKLVDAFAEIGVLPGHLAKYLGHEIATTTPAELAELRKVYVEVKSGDSNWADMMRLKYPEASASEDAKESPAAAAIKKRLEEKRAEQKTPEQPPEPEPAEPVAEPSATYIMTDEQITEMERRDSAGLFDAQQLSGYPEDASPKRRR